MSPNIKESWTMLHTKTERTFPKTEVTIRNYTQQHKIKILVNARKIDLYHPPLDLYHSKLNTISTYTQKCNLNPL